MKKVLLISVLFFGISLCSFAQIEGGGLFKNGAVDEEQQSHEALFQTYQTDFFRNLYDPNLPALPGDHDLDENQTSPLGEGLFLLIGLGAVYALKKKRK